jgi:cardiolipin synthase (CMP-forming)
MTDQGLTARGTPRTARRGRFGSLPNILTYGRILAIPALVGCFFVTGDWGRWVAMWIFIAAGVTDFLDGYLARAWEQQSAIGRMLDPVADKLIVSAALMMLAADGTIAGWSLWAGVIILCREILTLYTGYDYLRAALRHAMTDED